MRFSSKRYSNAINWPHDRNDVENAIGQRGRRLNRVIVGGKVSPLWVGCVLITGALSSFGCSHFQRSKEQKSPFKNVSFVKSNPTTLPTGFRDLLTLQRPSHDRRWKPSLAILPYAEFAGNSLTIRNVRDCRYRTEDDYDVRHFDLTFDLDEVRSVDFIVVPFQNAPLLAHTMLSFGLADGEHFVVSVEARLEQHEEYNVLGGSSRQFELMYVIGSEQDLIPLRTHIRKADVYIYRTNANPDLAQNLLVDVLSRVNQIARQPEFYDIFANNCTTNLVRHYNRVSPSRLPIDIRTILPGLSDRLVYQLGIIEANGSFEEVKARAHVNPRAVMYASSPDFSQKIRQR